MVIEIPTGRCEPRRQHHPEAPAELLRQIQTQFGTTNKSNRHQSVFIHNAYSILAQVKIQSYQLTDGGPYPLFITGPAMVEQILKRRFMTVGLKQDRPRFIEGGLIQSYDLGFTTGIILVI